MKSGDSGCSGKNVMEEFGCHISEAVEHIRVLSANSNEYEEEGLCVCVSFSHLKKSSCIISRVNLFMEDSRD